MSQEIESITAIVGQGSLAVTASLPQQPGRRERAAGPGPDGGASPRPALEVAHPDLGKLMQGLGPHVNIGVTYEVDRETKSVIIKVIDRDTNEVVRQIPPEEMVKLRAAMRHVFGLLFHAEV
jgi:uncharacterized FlaG/YvyC family protein